MPTVLALPAAAGSFPRPAGPLRLAVIGAGAAGLVAARELRRAGLGVVVFEAAGVVGGTWVYDEAVESDPLGVASSRRSVHSSLYASLRTNLPRECMGFRDYPFVPRFAHADGDRDPRRFPGHREVLRYLEDFARDFDLVGLIRFNTEVVKLRREKSGKWSVRSRRLSDRGSNEDDNEEEEAYDGVVVCNGHYTLPRNAEINGVNSWPGKQIHSHNYRTPDPFLDQVVVIVGNAASATDISRDVATCAKEVHIASRSAAPGMTPRKQEAYDNMWFHSMIESAHQDGSITFQDGSSVKADIILHCTGYKYHFPFLEDDVVIVDDNRIDSLYKHIFPPESAPGLSFIGIPWKVVPFPMFELQCMWVAGILVGRIRLPQKQEMLDDVKMWYKKIEADGWPKRYTHNLGNIQFEYDDWLAEQCGCPPIEEWRKQMYEAASNNRASRPESYRDEWNDEPLVAEAYKDFLM